MLIISSQGDFEDSRDHVPTTLPFCVIAWYCSSSQPQRDIIHPKGHTVLNTSVQNTRITSKLSGSKEEEMC